MSRGSFSLLLTQCGRLLNLFRFRWVACQIDVLKDCLDYPRLRLALENLPRTLDETYAQILERIPQQHLNQAWTILNLLIWSDWKFSIEDLVDAIATNLDEDPTFNPKNRMPVPRDVLKLCSSLLAVSWYEKKEEDIHRQEDAEVVQLGRFSVKEYLISDHVSRAFKYLTSESVARSYLARLCLTHLVGVSQFNLQMPFNFREFCHEFPFAYYSTQFWMEHARVAEVGDENLLKLVMSFFLTDHKAFSLFDSIHGWCFFQDAYEIPLYYAAIGGLNRTIKCLLDNGADINVKESIALRGAMRYGRETTVHLLLDKGADVDSGFLHAVDLAIYPVLEDYTLLMLDTGADINFRDGEALYVASSHGKDEKVQLLLDRGADPNAGGGRALLAASEEGRDKVVKLLLDGGADVNVRDGQALYVASSQGRDKLVQMLLDRGADSNAGNGRALLAASEEGADKVVKLLLDGGADPNAHESSTPTALQGAIGFGYAKLVRLLRFDRGGRAKVIGSKKLDRYHNIVQMLLDKGADVNILGGEWLPTLRVGGYSPQTVKQILEKKAPLSLDHILSAMLDTDSQAEEVVSAMLPYLTFEIAAPDSERRGYLLYRAVECGSCSVVQRCLDLGVDDDAGDGFSGTALHLAAEKANLAIVKMLVQAGSDIEALNGYSETPLMLAQSLITYGHEDKVDGETIRSLHDVVEYLTDLCREKPAGPPGS